MTYTVSSGTLNRSISYHKVTSKREPVQTTNDNEKASSLLKQKKTSINRRNLEEKYLRVSKMRNATTMRRRKNVTKMSLRLLSRLMYLCYCYIDTVFESRSFKTAAPMSRTHYMLTADCLEMILLVEWQEAHPACRNLASAIPMGSSFGDFGGEQA